MYLYQYILAISCQVKHATRILTRASRTGRKPPKDWYLQAQISGMAHTHEEMCFVEKITDEVSEDYIDREYTARTSPVRSVRHESPLTAVSSSKKRAETHTDKDYGNTPTKLKEFEEKEPKGYHCDSEGASASSSTERAPTEAPSVGQARPYVASAARGSEPYGATTEDNKRNHVGHGASHEACQASNGLQSCSDDAAHTKQNGSGIRRRARAESHVSLQCVCVCVRRV
jgi:hypothetical protein